MFIKKRMILFFYKEVHLKGPKRDFSYRFNAQERALMGGMRGVGIGALLGLHNFRNDALATGLHAKFLQQKYPHAEISFSVPRLRPYINNSENNPNDVHEQQLSPNYAGIPYIASICRH